MKLGEIAERLGCRLDGGAANVEITRVAGIELAGAGDLTFVANPKYQVHLATTRAAAVIVSNTAEMPPTGTAVLRCDNPYLAFAGGCRPAQPARCAGGRCGTH